MRRLALTAWLGVSTCLLICFISWRLETPEPSAALALAGLAALFAPLLMLARCFIRRLILRDSPLAALGWLLLGATPLVWFGCYSARLVIAADSRESIVLTAPLRTVVAGALNYFELESRVRGYRMTDGAHVRLYDRGAIEDPRSLATEMDRCVVGMARQLGQAPPSQRLHWVRGPILGFTGRCIVTWAMCEDTRGDGSITPLDRHEMAHALITTLAGPDHAPPAFLVEGWAEYHSADRNEQVLNLSRRLREEEAYPFDLLLGREWYGRSWGPAYWQGGPLTHHLIERFGAEKFFELYAGVRPATFLEDADSILGEPWRETEEKFWEWVRIESALLDAGEEPKAETPTVEIVLGPQVDPGSWRRLLAHLREAHGDRRQLPENQAVEISSTYTGTGEYAEPRELTIEALFEDQSFWVMERLPGNLTVFVASTPETSSYLMKHPTGETDGSVNDVAARRDAKNRAQNQLLHLIAPTPSFPWDDAPSASNRWRVEQVLEPESGSSDKWIATMTSHDPNDDEGLDTVFRHRFEIDPQAGWCVVHHTTKGVTTDWESVEDTEFIRLGERLLPVRTVLRIHSDTGSLEGITSLRLLDESECERLRERVDAAAAEGPTKKHAALRRAIPAVALAIPLLGLAFVLLGTRRPQGRSIQTTGR